MSYLCPYLLYVLLKRPITAEIYQLCGTSDISTQFTFDEVLDNTKVPDVSDKLDLRLYTEMISNLLGSVN